MGKIEYSYVVVTVSGQKLFVNKDMDYSDNFDDVMKFYSRDDALIFIDKYQLHSKNAKVITITEM